ncbi:MAG: dTDP-4-amino-4,6-dideoxygalactose transaminase [Alphaproteobacteria bacterium]|nr:MAG: dTDP-4-amino-4,6-dideoxygalactose transaminase [Alphaproteobacteria bacterium]
MPTEGLTPKLVCRNIPFNAPSLVGDEFSHIADAIHRKQLSGDGHYTKLCEIWLKNKTGASGALITHSCTAALEMAAILCDIGPGDEVIMPSFTFVSTANAVVMRGGVPVFVDIDPVSLNICPKKAQAAITERTKAIFVVHYAGVLADMPAFTKMGKAHNLLIVEDAAQALGSTLAGRPAGSLGDLATFSFHETKNVISGEGGALLINNPALQERAEIIREKGTNRSQFFRGQVDKYTWVDIGSSYLPGELIAAFLYAQLSQEDKIYKRRLEMWHAYADGFQNVIKAGKVRGPAHIPDNQHNGHMYYLLFDTLEQRQGFIEGMKGRNIVTPFHYVPLHSSPAGQKYARSCGDMGVTDMISETLVRLPIFYSLQDQQAVIDAAVEIIKG